MGLRSPSQASLERSKPAKVSVLVHRSSMQRGAGKRQRKIALTPQIPTIKARGVQHLALHIRLQYLRKSILDLI